MPAIWESARLPVATHLNEIGVVCFVELARVSQKRGEVWQILLLL